MVLMGGGTRVGRGGGHKDTFWAEGGDVDVPPPPWTRHCVIPIHIETREVHQNVIK